MPGSNGSTHSSKTNTLLNAEVVEKVAQRVMKLLEERARIERERKPRAIKEAS